MYVEEAVYAHTGCTARCAKPHARSNCRCLKQYVGEWIRTNLDDSGLPTPVPRPSDDPEIFRGERPVAAGPIQHRLDDLILDIRPANARPLSTRNTLATRQSALPILWRLRGAVCRENSCATCGDMTSHGGSETFRSRQAIAVARMASESRRRP